MRADQSGRIGSDRLDEPIDAQLELCCLGRRLGRRDSELALDEKRERAHNKCPPACQSSGWPVSLIVGRRYGACDDPSQPPRSDRPRKTDSVSQWNLRWLTILEMRRTRSRTPKADDRRQIERGGWAESNKYTHKAGKLIDA